MIRTDKPTAPFYRYACPETHTPLEVVDSEHLKSSATNRVYAVTRGIPNFSKYPQVESAEVSEKLRKLIQVCEKQGWERALRQEDPESLRYVLNESRAKYLDLLPLTARSRVLEIGASKGQHTYLIAQRCESLYALEVVEVQALFAHLRCAQLGRSNVSIAVGGDDCRLPYLSNTFDVVILNHVFEWCAGRASIEDPVDGQKRMLFECNRVLSAGGCLFLSTKNRYSLRLLAGLTDEHTGLPFGNALPRWLMMFILRLKGQRELLGLLHSHGALRKMILKVGFRRVDSYWALPDARFPSTYIEFKARSIRTARDDVVFSQLDRSTRFLLKYIPKRIIPWITQSLVFVAYKS